MIRCRECGTAKARYDDPRDPPLEEGDCLCAACFAGAAEERITELEEESQRLAAQVAQIDAAKARFRTKTNAFKVKMRRAQRTLEDDPDVDS